MLFQEAVARDAFRRQGRPLQREEEGARDVFARSATGFAGHARGKRLGWTDTSNIGASKSRAIAP